MEYVNERRHSVPLVQGPRENRVRYRFNRFVMSLQQVINMGDNRIERRGARPRIGYIDYDIVRFMARLTVDPFDGRKPCGRAVRLRRNWQIHSDPPSRWRVDKRGAA